MVIIDCCISLKLIKKNLIVLGVVDMRQLLLRGINFLFRLSIFLLFMRVESDVT